MVVYDLDLQKAVHKTWLSLGPEIKDYDTEDKEALEKATHTPELEYSDDITLCVDWRQGGIGSNSCGPEPQEKYRLRLDKPACLSFVIRYVNLNDTDFAGAMRVLPQEV